MSSRLTLGEELAGFTLGALPSFLINAAVKKHFIADVFDYINLPILMATAGVVGFQVYMKLKKKEPAKGANFAFVGLLGWFVGSWTVSQFINF